MVDKKEITIGSKHRVNDGIIEILEINNSRSILVRFLSTGFERIARAGDIRNGQVKDKLKPSVHGIGFIGDGRHTSKSKSYVAWADMISRCYGKASLKERPSYADCKVCDEWHNFQNFAEWHEENAPKELTNLQLDKDILSNCKRGKIYSPDTCLFVSPQENMERANARTHKIVSPDGDVLIVYNLNKFCKKLGLNNGAMNKISLNGSGSHKGWRGFRDNTKAP